MTIKSITITLTEEEFRRLGSAVSIEEVALEDDDDHDAIAVLNRAWKKLKKAWYDA